MNSTNENLTAILLKITVKNLLRKLNKVITPDIFWSTYYNKNVKIESCRSSGDVLFAYSKIDFGWIVDEKCMIMVFVSFFKIIFNSMKIIIHTYLKYAS